MRVHYDRHLDPDTLLPRLETKFSFTVPVTDEVVPVHPISVIEELKKQLLGHNDVLAFITAAAIPVGALPHMTAPVLGEPQHLLSLRSLGR